MTERIGRPCPMKDCAGHLQRLQIPVSIQENPSDELQAIAAEKHVLIFAGNEYEGHFLRCNQCGFTVIELHLTKPEQVPT